LEPFAVAPSWVAWAHRPEPLASIPLTLVQVATVTVLMAVPLIPRVCAVPSPLEPPIVVPPNVPPLAVALLEAFTSELKEVDSELAPFAMTVKPLDSDVTWLKPVDNDVSPVDREASPVEVELDNEDTLPFVVDKPVDSELTFDALLESPVERELMPLALVDRLAEVAVDSDETLLFVADKPVDREFKPAEVEVDKEFS